MGGGESENEEEEEVPSLAGVKLVDAPILFFVFFHKAFRKELQELHRIAMDAADNFNGSFDMGFLDNLSKRFQFFKFVYNYHSAAEDELIFTALDTRVKNVVSSYAMEHASIDEDFKSIFNCLALLSQDSGEEIVVSLFQKLIFSIGTIQTTISHHMLKEEEQVFRLLIQQFTLEEQAKLLWQYICSVPAVVVEDFLQWMSCSLSPNEQIDLQQCMKIVIPKEELFQEVVISWLENKQQCYMYGKEAQFYGGEIIFKEIFDMYCRKFHFGEEQQQSKKAYLSRGISRQNPFDSICIWNSAIRRGLEKVLEELNEMRSLNNISNSSSVVILLQFFLDVIICYSNVMDRVYYPLINELTEDTISRYSQQLVDENQVQRLVKLLHSSLQDQAQLRDFVEGLYREVELLVREISTTLIFLEIEVFPLISKNCSPEMQIWLLYAGLQTVPLGLLKWTVLWFSATLSEYQFKAILDGIKVESPMRKKYFSSLLREWLRTGYLGKASTNNFRNDLPEGSSMGSHLLPEQMKEAIDRYNAIELEPSCTISTKDRILNPSSSFSSTIEKLEVSYSGKNNVNMFFPGIWRNKVSVPKYPIKYGGDDNGLNLELGLEDHLFFFHKALMKDLEHIVLLSAKLPKDINLFPDFQRRFHQLQLLYDIHSETEDRIVFPYLESKGKLKNVTHSYSIDHKMENDHFKKISLILNKITNTRDDRETLGKGKTSYHNVALELHETCLSMKRIISDHFNREEIDLGHLFGEHFSTEEQYRIIGDMLGRTRGETLQEMIPWLMSCLTRDEELAILSLWRKVTKSTNFDEWLGEWWEGMKVYGRAKVEESFPSTDIDTREIVSKYLWNDTSRIEGNRQHKGSELSEKQYGDFANEKPQSLNLNKEEDSKEPKTGNCSENCNCVDQADDKQHPGVLSQEELETTIRRISRDSTLDSQKKSQLIQSLLVSRWMATQQRSNATSAITNGEEEDIGQCPSYQDSLGLIFGCKHYRRNCKILATCCNKLYTCIKCHDELADHSIDRKAITKMMCMKCLIIQPIGSTCSNLSCNNFSMARYYCKICRLWDDERQIYHCPYCNICRVGKGLGIDYFHCMNCNACMSRSLSVHICREKCFEDNCPICHEYIFTSSTPVKALPCGHLMHSACFQEYTCGNYTCPICSKSLGDMQVYFQMLDAFLAEEQIPEEYSGQTQVILCNDCERRGSAPFHWLYHKCPYCGSYNTRLL